MVLTHGKYLLGHWENIVLMFLFVLHYHYSEEKFVMNLNAFQLDDFKPVFQRILEIKGYGYDFLLHENFRIWLEQFGDDYILIFTVMKLRYLHYNSLERYMKIKKYNDRY